MGQSTLRPMLADFSELTQRRARHGVGAWRWFCTRPSAAGRDVPPSRLG
jgi:hypothetical protein